MHSDLCDRPLADRVTRYLQTKGWIAELAPAKGNVRKFLDERLPLCDATLLVNGQNDWTWVNAQLNRIVREKTDRQRSNPPRAPMMVGLLKAGRTNGDTLNDNLPELASYVIEGDMDDTSLNAVIDRFVEELSQRSHGQHAF